MEKKLRISAIACILLSLTIGTGPALANSAQMEWTGTSATGAIITDSACPIVVEKEVLTFDVPAFPKEDYTEVSEYLAYPASVTAEYSFHNPADYAVTATLVFPFGNIPDYAQIYDPETDERMWSMDTEKHAVTVDGKPIEKTLRHTWFPIYEYEAFVLERDMALLRDGFVDDPFYAPDMPVTRYTYVPNGVDSETYDAATATFVLSNDPTKTKVLLENLSGGRAMENAVRARVWIENGQPFDLYVIGKPLPEMPEWEIYDNGACENEIEGEMILAGTETMTFRDVVLTAYDPASGILEHDWYNAVASMKNMYEWRTYGLISCTDLQFHFDVSDSLMRWYEYEITLEPGESVVNTVSAPLYPSVDMHYEPAVYSYTYLLSPAKTWAAFGSLEVRINTPYSLTQSSPEGFEKTEAGYVQHLSGLPEGELTFVLCSEAAPAMPVNTSYLPIRIIAIAAVVLIAAAVLIVAIHTKTHLKRDI